MPAHAGSKDRQETDLRERESGGQEALHGWVNEQDAALGQGVADAKSTTIIAIPHLLGLTDLAISEIADHLGY
jgi:hypothetical protein